MRKRYLILTVILCIGLIACGKNENQPEEETFVPLTQAATSTPSPSPSPVPTETPVMTETPTPTMVPEDVIPEGMVKSCLTGLWIPEETAQYRPYAMMINNIKVASPQSGLSAADILYEVLVEYGITRFMAVFEAQDAMTDTSSRIGSVRSARHYFVNFANELDAIYVHFGGTSYATDQIKEDSVDEVDGIKGGLGNQAFSRDEKIKAPHNVFLNFSVMLNEVFHSKMRTEWEPGSKKILDFFEEDTTPESGMDANKVTIQFSQSVRPYLVYDEESGEYIRHQFEVVHKDANNDQPLTFKNIIVQYVKHSEIGNGYLTLELDDAEGDGYYITNGKAIPIVWKRNETPHECHYYDMSGNELVINKGKTYIAVYPDDYRGGVIFE